MEKMILKVENGQPVVTSRQIAGDFEKEHKNVVRAIEDKIESLTAQNCAVQNLFISSTFNHRGNEYKEYLLTRDGFTFIVMGFTGTKADIWKLKYIEAFNKMEQYIKEKQKPTCIEDVLIQSLQEMKEVKQQLNQINHNALQANRKAEETKEEVQAIRDVVEITPSKSWRSETNRLMTKICFKLKDYQKPKEEVYKALQERAGCDLRIRLKNMRARQALQGVSKSKLDELNYLDVIAQDKKLIEIYTAIVGQMAIKQGIRA